MKTNFKYELISTAC